MTKQNIDKAYIVEKLNSLEEITKTIGDQAEFLKEADISRLKIRLYGMALDDATKKISSIKFPDIDEMDEAIKDAEEAIKSFKKQVKVFNTVIKLIRNILGIT